MIFPAGPFTQINTQSLAVATNNCALQALWPSPDVLPSRRTWNRFSSPFFWSDCSVWATVMECFTCDNRFRFLRLVFAIRSLDSRSNLSRVVHCSDVRPVDKEATHR